MTWERLSRPHRSLASSSSLGDQDPSPGTLCCWGTGEGGGGGGGGTGKGGCGLAFSLMALSPERKQALDSRSPCTDVRVNALALCHGGTGNSCCLQLYTPTSHRALHSTPQAAPICHPFVHNLNCTA